MTLIIAAGGDSKHNESEDCAVSFGVVLVGDERGLARSRSRLAWLRLLKGRPYLPRIEYVLPVCLPMFYANAIFRFETWLYA